MRTIFVHMSNDDFQSHKIELINDSEGTNDEMRVKFDALTNIEWTQNVLITLVGDEGEVIDDYKSSDHWRIFEIDSNDEEVDM